MARLPHRCVMISVCLAGTLLLLPLCWGVEEEYTLDYDSTQSPEYDYDSTIAIFSNASKEVLEKFLMGEGTDAGGETSFTESETETETDGSVHAQKPTEPTVFDRNQASRPTPVYFLLTLVLLVHQLLRLL